MDTRPTTPADPTIAQESLQTVLLTIVTLVNAWLIYRVPWQVSFDPCLVAAVAAAVTIVCLWITRWRGLRGVNFERNLLALFLAGMPLVYVLRYLLSSRTGTPSFWAGVELLGIPVFGAFALLGLKRSPWFLAIGILAHGLAWDLWHYRTSTYIPDWYAIFCMAVDLALATYVAARVPTYLRLLRI